MNMQRRRINRISNTSTGKKGEDEEDAVSSAPMSVAETLEWEQVVLYTPTKVAKRPSLLDRLKRAKEEADKGLSEEEMDRPATDTYGDDKE